MHSRSLIDDIATNCIGSWRLVSYGIISIDSGIRSFPLGVDAHGLLIYAESGHMSVQIGTPGRLNYSDNSLHGGTERERAESARGYLAYAGRYSINGNIIEHLPYVSLFPNWENNSILRTAKLTNNQLVLEFSKPMIMGEENFDGYLIWERAEIFNDLD